MIVSRGGGSLEDLLPFYDEEVVKAIADSEMPVISAVGHEIDVTLTDLAADVRAPTPSAAAEMVAASRDDLLRRVRDAASGMRDVIAGRLERIRLVMERFSPENLERHLRFLIQPTMQRFDDAREQLGNGMKEKVTAARHRLQLALSELQAHSPLGVLERGYAVVTHIPTGKIVLSSAQASPGDDLRIRLHKGGFESKVTKITDENKEPGNHEEL